MKNYSEMSLEELEAQLAKLEQIQNTQLSDDEIYKSEAIANGVDPLFFKAIDQWESAGGQNNAVSPTGVVGRFQMTKGSADRYGVTDRTNFQDVARGAGKLVGDLNKKYSGDKAKVLAAYNTGEGVVDEATSLAELNGTDWKDEIKNTRSIRSVARQILRQTNDYGVDEETVAAKKAEEVTTHRNNIMRLYDEYYKKDLSSKSVEELEQMLTQLEGTQPQVQPTNQTLDLPQKEDKPFINKLGRGSLSAVAGIESAIAASPGFTADVINTVVNKPLDALIEKITGKKRFFGDLPSDQLYDIAGNLGEKIPLLKPVTDGFSSKNLSDVQKEYSESGKYQEEGKGIALSLYDKVKRGDIQNAAEYLTLATVENGTQNIAAILANFIPGLGPNVGIAILGGIGAIQAQQAQLEKEKKGEATTDRGLATLNSINQGLLEYAGEAVGTVKILDPLRNKFLKIAKEEGIEQAKKKIVHPITEFFKTLVKNTGKEVGSEEFTQVGQDLSDILSGVEKKSFKQVLSNMADAGVLAISTTGPIGTISSAVETKDKINQQKNITKDTQTDVQPIKKQSITPVDDVVAKYKEGNLVDRETIINNIDSFVSEEDIPAVIQQLSIIENEDIPIDEKEETDEEAAQVVQGVDEKGNDEGQNANKGLLNEQEQALEPVSSVEATPTTPEVETPVNESVTKSEKKSDVQPVTEKQEESTVSSESEPDSPYEPMLIKLIDKLVNEGKNEEEIIKKVQPFTKNISTFDLNDIVYPRIKQKITERDSNVNPENVGKTEKQDESTASPITTKVQETKPRELLKEEDNKPIEIKATEEQLNKGKEHVKDRTDVIFQGSNPGIKGKNQKTGKELSYPITFNFRDEISTGNFSLNENELGNKEIFEKKLLKTRKENSKNIDQSIKKKKTYTYDELVALANSGKKGIIQLKTIVSESGIPVKSRNKWQTVIYDYLTKYGSTDDIDKADQLRTEKFSKTATEGKIKAKNERLDTTGDDRKEQWVLREKELKNIANEGIVPYDPTKHDFIVKGFDENNKPIFSTKQLNDALDIIENKDGTKFLTVKDKTFKDKKGRILSESGLDILQDMETSSATKSGEAITNYNEEVKYADTELDDLTTTSLENEFDEETVVDIDEGAESNYVEDNDGLNEYRKAKDLLDEWFQNKKVDKQKYDLGISKLNEQFSEELEAVSKNRIKNISKSVNIKKPSDAVTDKEFALKVYKEALKLFPKLKNPPSFHIANTARFSDGITQRVMGKDTYGTIFTHNNNVHIFLNPRLDKVDIIPTIVHELFGHYGSYNVISNIDKDLGLYAKILYIKEYNNGDHKIDFLRKQGYDEDVLFDEWLARNADLISNVLFNEDGTLNAKYTANKYTKAIYDKVKAFFEFIRQLSKKLFKQWTGKAPTVQEEGELALALIHNFKKIKTGSFKTGALYELKKSPTTTNQNKNHGIKGATQRERMATFAKDRMAITMAKDIKQARVRFFEFATRHLYGDGSSSRREQIYKEMSLAKTIGDVHYNKALDLVKEFSDWQESNKEFDKFTRFVNKIYSAGRDKVTRVLDTLNTQEAIDLKKKINDILERKARFNDFQTLKRLEDRVTVSRPLVYKDEILKTRLGKFAVVDKTTRSRKDTFDTREEAREWIQNNSGKRVADVSDKYLSLVLDGYIDAEHMLPNEQIPSYKITETGKQLLKTLSAEFVGDNKTFGASDIINELNSIKEAYKVLADRVKEVQYQKKSRIASHVEDIQQEVSTLKTRWIKAHIKSEGIATVLNKFKQAKLHAEVLEYITETLGESFTNHVFNPLNEAVNKSLEFRYKYKDMLSDGLKKFSFEDLSKYTPISREGMISALLGEKKRKTDMVDWKLEGYKDPIKLTRSQRISLYMFSMNKEATQHVLDGGLYLTDKSTDKYKITDRDYMNLLEGNDYSITKEEKQIGDTFLKVYEEMGRDINKVSNKDIGRDIAGVEFYHPLLVKLESGIDLLDPKKITDLGQLNEFFRQGLPGNLKQRRNSGAPIILEGVFESFGRVQPLAEQYVGIYPVAKEVDSVMSNVKDDMTKKGLEEEYNIIKDYIRKISQPSSYRYPGESIVHFFDSLFIKAQLGYNIKTAALQWSAIPMYLTETDTSVISTAAGGAKLLPKTLKNYSEIKAKIEKYSPLLRERFDGMTTVEIGELYKKAIARKMIFKDPRALRKAFTSEGMTFPISKMDEFSIISQWAAAEYETRRDYPDLKPDTEQFDRTIAKKLETVVRRTQPVYHPLYRPMIANIPVIRPLTYFSSAPFQFLMVSVRGAKMIAKGSKQILDPATRHEGTGNILKGILNIQIATIFQAAAYAFNAAIFRYAEGKDQEDEDKTLKNMIANMLSIFPVIGPIIGSLVTGYDLELGGPLAMFIKQNLKNVKDVLEGNNDPETMLKNLKNTAAYVEPIRGPERIVNIVKNLSTQTVETTNSIIDNWR